MARRISREEGRQSLKLWFGLLAAPVAWAVQLAVAPDLTELLCLPGSTASGRGEVYGLSIEVFILALSAGLTLVAVLGGLAAASCRRKILDAPDPTPGGRAGWMARAGVMVSSLFTLAIVVGFIPAALLESCGASL